MRGAFPHSQRSARTGSTAAARRAGSQLASTATAVKKAVTESSVTGSDGLTFTRKAPRRRAAANAPREPERQSGERHGERAPKHQQSDVAASGAEGHADADLPGPLGDHVRHHPVESERGEQGGDRAEAGQHRRSDPLRQHGQPEMLLHRARLDRQLRVEGVGLANQRIEHRARIGRGSRHQHHVRLVRLRERLVEVRLRSFRERAVLAVPHHAHHLPSTAPAGAEPAADGVLAGPESAGEALVHHRDRLGARAVARLECAPSHDLDSHRLEVARAHRVDAELHVLAFGGRVTFHFHAAPLTREAQREDLGQRRRFGPRAAPGSAAPARHRTPGRAPSRTPERRARVGGARGPGSGSPGRDGWRSEGW